jgi:hypothetical protein
MGSHKFQSLTGSAKEQRKRVSWKRLVLAPVQVSTSKGSGRSTVQQKFLQGIRQGKRTRAINSRGSLGLVIPYPPLHIPAYGRTFSVAADRYFRHIQYYPASEIGQHLQCLSIGRSSTHGLKDLSFRDFANEVEYGEIRFTRQNFRLQ